MIKNPLKVLERASKEEASKESEKIKQPTKPPYAEELPRGSFDK